MTREQIWDWCRAESKEVRERVMREAQKAAAYAKKAQCDPDTQTMIAYLGAEFEILLIRRERHAQAIKEGTIIDAE